MNTPLQDFSRNPASFAAIPLSVFVFHRRFCVLFFLERPKQTVLLYSVIVVSLCVRMNVCVEMEAR